MDMLRQSLWFSFYKVIASKGSDVMSKVRTNYYMKLTVSVINQLKMITSMQIHLEMFLF